MSVKRSQSGSRVLAVLEAIASHQPIGVRALARVLDEDKSAIQRALATLADSGWIRLTREPPARWEVTAHILTVAQAALGSNDLRQRARLVLERLRDTIGETVFLAVPDIKNFVVADVVESRQMLRMVPHVGVLIAPQNSATGRALLPFMSHERLLSLLGAEPDPEQLASFASTRARGYAVSEGEINVAATNLAAPIFEFDGTPAGAIVICGPRERLPASQHAAIGAQIIRAARELSHGVTTPETEDTPS